MTQSILCPLNWPPVPEPPPDPPELSVVNSSDLFKSVLEETYFTLSSENTVFLSSFTFPSFERIPVTVDAACDVESELMYQSTIFPWLDVLKIVPFESHAPAVITPSIFAGI